MTIQFFKIQSTIDDDGSEAGDNCELFTKYAIGPHDDFAAYPVSSLILCISNSIICRCKVHFPLNERRPVSKGGGLSCVDTARRGRCAQDVARLGDRNDGFILRTGICHTRGMNA